MTTIKLTHDIVKNDIFYEESDFEFDGETYEYVEELDRSMDEHGRDFTYLYKRKSDGKYFRITVWQERQSYEDYCYEEYGNDCELIEVEKREKVITIWEAV